MLRNLLLEGHYTGLASENGTLAAADRSAAVRVQGPVTVSVVKGLATPLVLKALVTTTR